MDTRSAIRVSVVHGGPAALFSLLGTAIEVDGVRHLCCSYRFPVAAGSHAVSISYRRLLPWWPKNTLEVDVLPGEVKHVTFRSSLPRLWSGELREVPPPDSGGWLRVLRQYAGTWQEWLDQKRFVETTARDGPGMGAVIVYSNGTAILELINDRSQYFIEIVLDRSRNKTVDIYYMVDVIHIISAGRHVSDYTEEEKHELYDVTHGFSDPIRCLAHEYDNVVLALDADHYDQTIQELDCYLEGMRDWRRKHLGTSSKAG